MTDRTDARQHDRTTTRTRPTETTTDANATETTTDTNTTETLTDTNATETMTDTNATETERRRTDRTEYRPTLQDLSHTNPYTGDVFGDTQTYGRGKAVAADGGRRDAGEEATGTDDDARDVDEETMEDVAHEPPGEADGAQAAYDRGAGNE